MVGSFIAVLLLMYWCGVIISDFASSFFHDIKYYRLENKRKEREREWESRVTNRELENEIRNYVIFRKPEEVSERINDILKDVPNFSGNVHLYLNEGKIKKKFGMNSKKAEECRYIENRFAIRTIMASHGKLTTLDAMFGISDPWNWYMCVGKYNTNFYCDYLEWINKMLSERSGVKERLVVQRHGTGSWYDFNSVRGSVEYTIDNVAWEPIVLEPNKILYSF